MTESLFLTFLAIYYLFKLYYLQMGGGLKKPLQAFERYSPLCISITLTNLSLHKYVQVCEKLLIRLK